MSIELAGRLVKIMAPQTGSGRNGNWVKQEFIIETAEQYPKKVCISAWGEKVDELGRLNIGDELKVAVNIESREYNDRWYTDVRAWRIEPARAGGNQRGPQGGNDFDDLGPEPYSDQTGNIEDDLPF